MSNLTHYISEGYWLPYAQYLINLHTCRSSSTPDISHLSTWLIFHPCTTHANGHDALPCADQPIPGHKVTALFLSTFAALPRSWFAFFCCMSMLWERTRILKSLACSLSYHQSLFVCIFIIDISTSLCLSTVCVTIQTIIINLSFYPSTFLTTYVFPSIHPSTYLSHYLRYVSLSPAQLYPFQEYES